MARYIDADNFCGWLETVLKDFGEPNISIRPVAYGSLNALKSVLEIMKKQPAADVVEVKHGEWICLEEEIGLYCCSLCEHNILRAECNYCPHCGAKMDGGKTE